MKLDKRYQTTRTVSFVNGGVNFFLAVIKVVIGSIGQSHALVADGLHSFSDLFNDALVLLTAKAGSRHPDREHPYGHRRIETIGTIIIALILIGVAFSISFDSLRHLIKQQPTKIKEISVLVVAIISIIANEWMYRYTLAAGKKINSNLLISNAWHNRSDAFVSGIVLLSVIGGMIGIPYLDIIGAIIIAILIFKMGLQILWTGIKELIDTAVDEKTLAKITQYTMQIPGVNAIHQLRTRMSGGHIFIDLHIIVDPFISVSEGHFISDQVYINLMKNMSNITDVTVHIDAEDDELAQPSSHLPNRNQLNVILKKYWEKLPAFKHIQKITLHYLGGHLHIEIYIPQSVVSPLDQTGLMKQYQDAIKNEDYITNVTVHFISNGKK